MPTYLDERWFSGPAVDEDDEPPPATLLRFGPGVPRTGPAPVPVRTPAPAPAPAPDPGRAGRTPRRRLLRYWPVAVVLAALCGYLVWRQLDPGLAVEGVAVRTDSERVGCGQTAVVTGTVTTNGGSGTLLYRWLRSDGTESGTLRERLPRGQETISVTLRWDFKGAGSQRASATLEVLSPSTRTAAASFTYSCR